MDLFRLYKGKKNTQDPVPQPEKLPLKTSLAENLKEIREKLGESNDLIIREIKLTGANQVNIAILGIDGLIDGTAAQEFVVHILAIDMPLFPADLQNQSKNIFDTIYESRISMMSASLGDDFNKLYTNLLTGQIIVLVDGIVQCMCFDCKGWQMRGIGESNVEKSLRGPKDSFVETIRVNTALLRRRIKDPRLRFDTHIVGRRTKTDVFVTYIDGLTNPKFVQMANERIQEIDMDSLMSSSELVPFLEDKHLTIFPRIIESERPDKVAASLLEGQVVVFVDGSPFALIGPFYFTAAFQAIDDYYNHPFFATFKRIMRSFAYFAIIFIPGFYIAASTYHQEMIPTTLLITVMNQRSENPFSTLVETLIILLLFEILREASLRKPDVIGDSMTLAASLIVGQTLVEVGLISYAAIIVGSLTTIASFVVSATRINVSARIFTVIFMIIGAQFGLFGLTLGYIMFITHLCSLTTFGEPYLAPLAPFNLSDQKDQFIKLPNSWMKFRPKVFQPRNQVRHNLSNLDERKE